MNKFWIFAFTIGLVIQSCQSSTNADQRQNDLSSLTWLSGHWSTDETEPKHEVWSFQNDSIMTGMAYRQKGRQALDKEMMRLFLHKGFIFLESIVTNQNKGNPILFELTDQTKTKARFENPNHDWPQYIEYNLNKDGALNIDVGGMEEDARKVEMILLRRGNN